METELERDIRRSRDAAEAFDPTEALITATPELTLVLLEEGPLQSPPWKGETKVRR
jgi:hypothetical protein